MLAPGFQIVGGRIGPSHAHVHMVQMHCDVNIFGMLVRNDDVVHADFHGAVVIPADAVRALPEAIDLISRREKVILDMARGAGFTSAGYARGAAAPRAKFTERPRGGSRERCATSRRRDRLRLLRRESSGGMVEHERRRARRGL